jgi:hypothetical protein
VKRLLLLVTACAALWASACGNGGYTAPTPPPSTGPFSKANLNGQYAFSMGGSNAFGNFARVGTFTADGQGNITGGLEDANFPGAVNLQVPLTGGTYTVNPDGRGSMTFSFAAGNSVDFSITLASSTNGFMVDTTIVNGGVAQTGSGNFVKQDASALALAGINGNYAFDFSGSSPDGTNNPISIIGTFKADGAGNLMTGFDDVVELGSGFTPKAAIGTSVFSLDNAHSGTGRGTANIAGFNYVFYIVSHNQIKFMGTDSAGELLGDAVLQQANTPANATAMNGGFVFIVGGSTTSGTLGQAGRFTADGGGKVSAVFLDVNNSGSFTAVPSGATGLTGTYQVDGDTSGHGTLTFTDSIGGTGTYTYGFYLISPTQAVFQNQSIVAGDPNGAPLVADGSLSAQTGGPFTASSLAPTFAFSLSGVDSNGLTGSTAQDDFVGQATFSSLSYTGAMDFNEFSAGTLYLDIPVNGAIALNGDGTGVNTQVFNLQPPAKNQFNFVVLIANPNTLYVLGSDSNRVISGIYTAQSQ